MTVKTKTCKYCLVEKITSDFWKCARSKDRLDYKCKICSKLINRQWHRANRARVNEVKSEWSKKNPDKVKNTSLKKSYKIDLIEYNNMLTKQNNKCAICSEESAVKCLAVDHDHKTGKIRGLLCNRCNTGLGMFRDNIDLIILSGMYLSEHST